MKNTPLTGEQADEKANIIEHVNEDHLREVMYIVNAFTKIEDPYHATLADMFVEGVLLEITPTEGAMPEKAFVKYTTKGTPHEQVRYLAFDAMRKLKIKSDAEKIRYFWVREKMNVTEHMLRLSLECNEALPLPQAGFACSFAIAKRKKILNPDGWPAMLSASFMRAMFVLIKKLPPKWRETLFERGTQYRAYTYRQIFPEQNRIHVDVYLHGDTPANRWADSLNVGDVVFSAGERGEDFDYLHSGKVLLCADETALPAVAGILSFWQNPEPPIVILEVGDEAEFRYFDDIDNLPDNADIRWRLRSETRGEEIQKEIDKIESIDKAWGALENTASRNIRNYVRKQFGLPTRLAKITPYWRDN